LGKGNSPVDDIEKVEKDFLKHPFRTRQEIITDIFESKMHAIDLKPFKDDGYMTRFSRFLRERGVANDAIHDLLHCLNTEPIKNWNDLLVVAIESAGGSSTGFDWLPWYLNSRDDCQDWLTKIMEAAKVPTEAINSIIVGLMLGYEPARKELREILSKQGIANNVIDWLITKLSGHNEK
jgi:pimeloyl-CoA synthetase